MKYKQWFKHDPVKNYFQLPNEIFLLVLLSGVLAVYSYLLCCENRKSYQCRHGHKTIGQAVRMSENTVREYIRQLEEQGLITTESAEVITRTGMKRNGNLRYIIRLFQEVIDKHYDRQLNKLKMTTEQHRIAKLLEGQKSPT